MNVNLDWVEEQTGDAGPTGCARWGHQWVCIDDEPRLVQGHPAGRHECVRCGEERFLWLASGWHECVRSVEEESLRLAPRGDVDTDPFPW